jgi:hypothetical protein
MREYRTRSGGRAIWLSQEENETIIEDELRKAGMFPSAANPVVDVEGILEQYLCVKLDQHAPLEPSVLGVTEFFAGAQPKVSINRDLTGAMEEGGEASVLGRWRATLAHEASHVILHRAVFELDERQQDMFGPSESSSSSQKLMRCLKRNVFFRSGGSQWHEVQANRGMAAMLMPREVFRTAAIAEKEKINGMSGRILRYGDKLASALAERFNVSRQAAAIRLATLGMVNPPNQLQLSS